MLYYKAAGKKIAFTAHNVNQARRDAKDSLLNRATLRIQYRLCDHIFVHTQKMKDELCQDFDVGEKAVTVIRHPINDAFPDTELTPAEAKRHLGLRDDEKAILFFGRIRPYKGIEHLLDAFRLLSADEQAKYRLIVAGEPKKGSEEYLNEIQQTVKRDFDQGQVILKIQFIPDKEMEVHFKGADVLVLPYKEIFQSGVLFLAYSFGLPVVATDVGSFREEIVEGSTGFLCKPGDPAELAKAIETYFASDLFKNLTVRRQELKDYANANHSWHAVAELTRNAYTKMSGRNRIMKPLVSILIPAYNAEAWISDTLRSALAQTWQPKEIIVVDDGSKDQTFAVARKFESDQLRVVTRRIRVPLRPGTRPIHCAREITSNFWTPTI